jgi:ribosomal protein L37AE/L43A
MGESGKDVYRNMAKDSFAAITAAGGQIFTHHDMEYLLESRPISPAAEGSAGQFVQTPQSANPSCQMCGKEMVRRYEAGEIKAWPWVCKSCGATTKPTEPGSAGQPHADNCPANLRNIKITFTQGGNAGCTPTPWKEGESVFIPAAKCTCGATGPTEEGK